CPLWSKSGQIVAVPRLSALCHVWTAPSWQGLSSRLQHWSVQPCVRPVSAAHVAAGHNALRGSGPGHKHAFDNALAQVGCPDRRIDRLCITCCLPSQPSHHAGCPARSRLRRECDGFLVALAPGHHGPGHPRKLVGKRDGSDLRWSPHQQCRQTTKIFRNIPNLFSVATRWRFGTKTQQPPRGRLCEKLHIFSALSWLRG